MSEERYSDPVRRLLERGKVDYGEWDDYTLDGIGPEHVDELIRMAGDMELNNGDPESLEVWAPLHAVRALGQLRAEAAVGPLLDLLDYAAEVNEDWFLVDIPHALERIGPAAVQPAGECLLDSSRPDMARAETSHALRLIASAFKEARRACAMALSRALQDYRQTDRFLNAVIVWDLVELRAIGAAPLMEAAFEADVVDLAVGGDWEEAQIELGLLEERLTPARDWFRESMGLPPLAELEALSISEGTGKKQKRKRKQQKQARQRNQDR